jgi:hypothetical protein
MVGTGSIANSLNAGSHYRTFCSSVFVLVLVVLLEHLLQSEDDDEHENKRLRLRVGKFFASPGPESSFAFTRYARG